MKIPGRAWTWMKISSFSEAVHILNFGVLNTTSYPAHRQTPSEGRWRKDRVNIEVFQWRIHRITLGHHHQVMWLPPTQKSPYILFSAPLSHLRLGQHYLESEMRGIITLFSNLIVILIKVIHVQSFKSPTILQGFKMKNASLPVQATPSLTSIPQRQLFSILLAISSLYL